MILLGICSPARSIWKLSFMSFLTRNSQIFVVFASTYHTVRDSTGCVTFLTCEKYRSLLWLARTHLHIKFTTQLFIEYIWSIHMIKESEGFAEMIPYFPPAKVTSCENFHFFASSVWQLIFTLCVVWLKSYPVSWWEKEKKLHRAVKLSMSSKEGKTGYHGHVKVCPTAFFSFPMSFICASPNALYLSVNVFSTFYVLIRATRRSSRLQGNAVP